MVPLKDSLSRTWRKLLARRPGTAELADEVRALTARVAQLERRPHHSDALFPAMAWIEQAKLEREPLISVVMPTHDRARLLERAIRSVAAQTYERWELVVVDDASTDGTKTLLDRLKSPQIRVVRVDAGGDAAARNAGLDLVEGEIVAYLDDDNTMHRGWLRSVAWGFEQRPDADVLYGAFVVDDFLRFMRSGSGGWPVLALNEFDREILTDRGLTDISAIAHRAGLPGARFDPSLPTASDWDLLVRLTADRDPVVIPAIAGFYYTDAPNRLSRDGPLPEEITRVRERARSMRR